MESKILEKLLPLWDITSAVEQLIDENKEVEEENKKLKERIKWFEDSLEKMQRLVVKQYIILLPHALMVELLLMIRMKQ